MPCVLRHALKDGQCRRSHASVYVRNAGPLTSKVEWTIIDNICACLGTWTGNGNSGTEFMPMLHQND